MSSDEPEMASENISDKKEKIRRKAPIKIVLRRLPTAMTWDLLQTQLHPLPETDYCEFVAADPDERFSFARVYFVFKNDEDLIAFKNRFNGYIFIDSNGQESMGLVELAPNPKIYRHKLEDSKKRDKRCGTIESEIEYKIFLDCRENPVKPEIVPIEKRIREIEEKERLALENSVQETPLTQFFMKKMEEKYKRLKRIREDEKARRSARDEEKRIRAIRLQEKILKVCGAQHNEAKNVTEFYNTKFDKKIDEHNTEKEKEKKKKRCFQQSSSGYRNNNDNERINSIKKDKEKTESIKLRENSDEACNGIKEKLIERINLSHKSISKKKVTKNDCSESLQQNLEKNSDAKSSDTHTGSDTFEEKMLQKERLSGDHEEEANKIRRRNKDRPERAIYQPAARRRAAALANTLGTSSIAEKR